MNLAHRGARSIAPENTLVAGRKAFEAGADMWEFDVQLTADKKPIVVHDRTLTRTTNVEEVFPDRSCYKVDDFTLAEIKQLDAGSWFVREDPLPNPVEKLKSTGATFYCVKDSMLARGKVSKQLDEITEAGAEYAVIVWTVNRREHLRKVVENPHVGGVVTDYPARLAKLLE